MAALFTVGHSTRTLDEFVDLLRCHDIRRVVDVRTIPRSRHNPQFNRDVLAKCLRNRRILYRHMKSLGGLRHTRKDSANMGWRNPSFRGFADYMQTDEFASALEALLKLARGKRTAILCAESVPWRCHRSLIADALTVRGMPVMHIVSRSSARLHKLNVMARVKRGTLTYPAEVQPANAISRR